MVSATVAFGLGMAVVANGDDLMTNGEVLKLYEALEHISSNQDLKFNIRIGYALAKNREILRSEAKVILELRQKVFLKYGEPNDKGEIIVPKAKVDALSKELDELMGIENNVKIVYLPIDAFDDVEDKLSLDDISGLSYMIFMLEYTGEPIEKQEQ